MLRLHRQILAMIERYLGLEVDKIKSKKVIKLSLKRLAISQTSIHKTSTNGHT
jgi:hypothetical protein